MNSIDLFHQRLKVESAFLVADAGSLGREVCALALRRGIQILEARVQQLTGEPAGRTAPPPQLVLQDAPARPASARAAGAAPVGSALMELIDQVVAQVLNVPIESLHSTSRDARLHGPRMVAMALARAETDSPYQQIATWYGKKDHTTAIYAVTAVEDRIAKGTLGVDFVELRALYREARDAQKAAAA